MSQNFAPSLCSVQSPNTSLCPPQLTPVAKYTALLRTKPSSRIFTRTASKNTMAYTRSKGRDPYSATSSNAVSVTFEISSADTVSPHSSAT